VSDAPLPIGKLPPDLLRSLVLNRLGTPRPETRVRAQVGIDAAAVALDESGWLCVVKSDPITTASAGAGRLAVIVVCNDLAVMGAEPVGVLATLLFPAGTRPSAIAALAGQIDAAARELGVEVLGGHTEIAPSVSTALVVMSGIGRARADGLVTAAGARPGDALLLTRAAGLEGTSILATDFAAALEGRVDANVLEEARRYAAETSVVSDALRAAELGVTAMHDPTEGGVLGALWEMAEASGVGFRVAAESIPVRPATRLICGALDVDPLRLIASGALLIACRDPAPLMDALPTAARIGEITPGQRLLVQPDRSEVEIGPPTRDELYRLLEAS
jgi:hydrogenase expression/formation protein HypE